MLAEFNREKGKESWIEQRYNWLKVSGLVVKQWSFYCCPTRFTHSVAKLIFQATARVRCLSPQGSSSIEKESVMDEGNVSNTPPLLLQLEREIKFNEHFYYVPGALHMSF